MPPRLPTTSCASLTRTLLRPFATTSPAAFSPREPPHAPSPASSPSSSSSSSSTSPNSRLAHLNSPPARGPGIGQRADATMLLMERHRAKSAAYTREKSAQMDFLRNQKMSNDYLKQMPRRWEAGDVYSPHDLSPVEMQKWRKRTLRNNDVVDALGISPLDMYKNFSLIEHFTTPSGMINHSKFTRLRPVNQRKVAKMVRRVQGMGIYPSVHAHPEMLRDQFFSRHR